MTKPEEVILLSETSEKGSFIFFTVSRTFCKDAIDQRFQLHYEDQCSCMFVRSNINALSNVQRRDGYSEL